MHACTPPAVVLALALALALASARAADAQPIALPALHAGDHAHYVVRDCAVKTDDRRPPPAGVKAPTCRIHDLDVTILAVDSDGGVRTHWVAKGPADDYPLAVMEQSTDLVRRAVAHGVPVELSIAPNGASATLVDATALRAGLKGYVDSLGGAPARADDAQVRRISQQLEALRDSELLLAVWTSVKPLYVARFAALVPSTSADAVEPAEGLDMPMEFDLDRHTDISALAANGQGLQVTTTQSIQGERAKAWVSSLADAARARAPMSPRDEADLRDLLASPPPPYARPP